MRIASSPHSSRALAPLPPKFPLRPWLVLSLLLSFVSGHERIETFSIRFFVGNWKPQTWECHVTTVLLSRLPFGVHVWTAGRGSIGKWLVARFFIFASKNCTASRLKARTCFDVLLRFLISKQWIIYVFGRKERSTSNLRKTTWRP